MNVSVIISDKNKTPIKLSQQELRLTDLMTLFKLLDLPAQNIAMC